MDAPKYKLVLLAPAQRELEEIASAYLELTGSDSARKRTDRIYSALALLQEQPNIGVSCKDKPLRLQGYRMLICDRYLCVYRLVDDTVYVYHIADGRTDYPRLMRDLDPSD